MPATAWLLGIANPQSIKWLGHFLTADCKSAGTPNGGKAYPALRIDFLQDGSTNSINEIGFVLRFQFLEMKKLTIT